MTSSRRKCSRLRHIWRRVTTDRLSVFLVGVLIGVFLALLAHYSRNRAAAARASAETNGLLRPNDFAYELWLAARGMESVPVDPDVGRYNMSAEVKSEVNEAEFLKRKVHVTCLLFPETVKGAKAVKETWGGHCNELRFYSHKLSNDTHGVEKIAVKSSFALLCSALHKIRDSMPKNLQWVLVATDDTFVLVENLRHFVAPKSPSRSHYLGHAMTFWAQVYNWGDAGYVLSRRAVDRLLDEKFPTLQSCGDGGRFWKNGDWHLGKHLATLDIRPVDTRDHRGRGRFNGYTFKKMLIPGAISMFDRYWRDSLYLSPDGPKCCSNHAVTFHGILSHSKMYQLEYLFHRLRPFYGSGRHGNVKAKTADGAGPGGIKETFLTVEEMMKDKYLAKIFEGKLDRQPKQSPLLTTDKGDSFDLPRGNQADGF